MAATRSSPAGARLRCICRANQCSSREAGSPHLSGLSCQFVERYRLRQRATAYADHERHRLCHTRQTAGRDRREGTAAAIRPYCRREHLSVCTATAGISANWLHQDCLNQRRLVLCKTAHNGHEKPLIKSHEVVLLRRPPSMPLPDKSGLELNRARRKSNRRQPRAYPAMQNPCGPPRLTRRNELVP